jgi:broad specificity phosphatase PhoE
MLQDLRELNFGEWEGKTWPQVMCEFPVEYSAFISDPAACGCPAGENLTQVQTRMLRTLRNIGKAHINERILVISHLWANRAFLAGAMGLSCRCARDIDQDPGCVNTIRFMNGNFELGSCNQQLYNDEKAEIETC